MASIKDLAAFRPNLCCCSSFCLRIMTLRADDGKTSNRERSQVAIENGCCQAESGRSDDAREDGALVSSVIEGLGSTGSNWPDAVSGRYQPRGGSIRVFIGA